MGEAGAGARKCAVFQNKAKCVVSCPPASGRGGEEGGGTARIPWGPSRIYKYIFSSSCSPARTPAPPSTQTQPAASVTVDTQLQHLSRICIKICNTPPNNYSVVKS